MSNSEFLNDISFNIKEAADEFASKLVEKANYPSEISSIKVDLYSINSRDVL